MVSCEGEGLESGKARGRGRPHGGIGGVRLSSPPRIGRKRERWPQAGLMLSAGAWQIWIGESEPPHQLCVVDGTATSRGTAPRCAPRGFPTPVPRDPAAQGHRLRAHEKRRHLPHDLSRRLPALAGGGLHLHHGAHGAQMPGQGFYGNRREVLRQLVPVQEGLPQRGEGEEDLGGGAKSSTIRTRVVPDSYQRSSELERSQFFKCSTCGNANHILKGGCAFLSSGNRAYLL